MLWTHLTLTSWLLKTKEQLVSPAIINKYDSKSYYGLAMVVRVGGTKNHETNQGHCHFNAAIVCFWFRPRMLTIADGQTRWAANQRPSDILAQEQGEKSQDARKRELRQTVTGSQLCWYWLHTDKS